MAIAQYEQPGFSFMEGQLPIATLEVWPDPDTVAEPPLYGSNGDRLNPVAFSFNALELYWEQQILQRQMRESTVVSSITGCWLPTPERYRAAGGYVPVRDKGAAVSPSSSTSRHRAVWQRINLPRGEQPLTPEDTWEHYCRTPGCSNPHHGEMMSIEENSKRKDRAKTLENHLLANQPMITLAGLEWLESFVDEAGEDLLDVIVSTRYGAYLLEVDGGALIGHHLPDPAREAMRKAAPYRHQKEKFEVHSCQLSIDSQEMYHELLRRAVAKRQSQYTPTPTPALAAA